MTAAVFRHPLRVTYADCTVGNHVYYARYLDFLEVARGEFFRRLGQTFQAWQEQGFIFPVIECRLRYRAAARYDDQLVVELQVAQAAGIRLGFAGRIVRADGTLIVVAETQHVCTGLDEKPRRLPESLRSSLEPFRIQAQEA